MTSTKEKCICQICNCGRHRCPHKVPSKGPFGECNVSEYTNKYVPYKLSPLTNYKPLAAPMTSETPLSDQTTHRVDYIEHPLDYKLVGPPNLYKAPDGDFDGVTSYTQEYTAKKGEKAEPFQRPPPQKSLGRFEGEPTYRHDYREWEMKPVSALNRSAEYNPPQEPFDGIPSYTIDYPAYQNRTLTENYKPNQIVRQSSEPFPDMTENRQSYVPHPLERRQWKEKAEWTKPDATFNDLTTFKRDYTAKDIRPTENYKPLNKPMQSLEPLQRDTTHRVDYQEWNVERPFQHQYEQYRQPDGDIDHNTTYLNDFPAHRASKLPPLKPKEVSRSLGAFQGITNYQNDYPWRNSGPRNAIGPNREYKPNESPFAGESAYTAHYVPHKLNPNVAYGPNRQAVISDAPFDDKTMYRVEYNEKVAEPCPAAILETPRSNFEFTGQDSNTGHKFFAPKNEYTTLPELLPQQQTAEVH